MLLLVAGMAFAQKNHKMETKYLSARQLHLATLASLEAQGDMTRLETAVAEALEAKVTVNEIKEAFSQL